MTDVLHAQLARTLDRVPYATIGGRALPRYDGKVRDCFIDGERGERIIVVTDRLSAFDAVVGTIPFKGQVLNQLAQFWFEHTRHIAPNHMLRVPDPNVMIVRECDPLPVELVMRAYLTGVTSTSIWKAYEAGARTFCGHVLPSGLRKNDKLPHPILTPSTKAAKGDHDMSASRAEILAMGQMSAEDFDRAAEMCARVFAFGQVESLRRLQTDRLDGRYVEPSKLTGVTTAQGGDTIYLSVIDKDGNIVSLIQSLYSSWGSGIVAPDTGVMLHNRGALFTLEAGHPNLLAGHKRPLTTLVPAFMSKGDVKIGFGIMGGFNQAQAHAQFVSNVADFGLDVQEALEAGRFTKTSFEGCDVDVEQLVPEKTRTELEALGDEVRVIPPRIRPTASRARCLAASQANSKPRRCRSPSLCRMAAFSHSVPAPPGSILC